MPGSSNIRKLSDAVASLELRLCSDDDGPRVLYLPEYRMLTHDEVLQRCREAGAFMARPPREGLADFMQRRRLALAHAH